MPAEPYYTIEARDLTKQYPTCVAVDGMDLAIESGQIVILVGPNGAGKTTLMKMLGGALPPTSGTARLAGHDVTSDPIAVKRQVGVLPEGMSLYWRRSLRDNLVYFGRFYGMNDDLLLRRIEQSVEVVKLTQDIDRRVGEFSKGMKKRAMLARCLLHQPKLLILDEPTADLDPEAAQTFRDHLRHLRDKHEVTILLSTHYLQEACELGDRLLVISYGRIVSSGTPEEIAAKADLPARLEIRSDLGPDQIKHLLTGLPGIFSVAKKQRREGISVISLDRSAPMGDAIRRLENSGGYLLSANRGAIELERAYLELVHRMPDMQGKPKGSSSAVRSHGSIQLAATRRKPSSHASTPGIRNLIRHDMVEVLLNRQVIIPILIFSLLFSSVIPLLVTLLPAVGRMPLNTLALAHEMVEHLPLHVRSELTGYDATQLNLVVTLRYFLAPMFALLPLLMTNFIAAGSIAGEREQGTLEALAYVPITASGIWLGKVIATSLFAMALCLLCFVLYVFVANAVALVYVGELVVPTMEWIVLLFTMTPALVFFGTGIMVIISAKATGTREAQQMGGFIVLPAIGALVAQATGLIFWGTTALLIATGLVLVADVLLLRLSRRLMEHSLTG